MRIEKALTLHLGRLDQPVITAYDLGLMIYKFYRDKKYQGEHISITKDIPGMEEYSRLKNRLTMLGVLEPVKGFPEGRVFSVLGKKDFAADDLVCAVDPFAYLSHLSAMSYHGLTDRLPKLIFVSTPPPVQWSKLAKQKMSKDYEVTTETYGVLALPKLTRIKFEKAKGIPINRYSSKDLGAYKAVRGRVLRVSSVGRTFLDMLREPKLCGGIRHVLDVFKENAKNYKRLIMDEVDRNGNIIEKVRAGYILDEVCGIKDEVINEWIKLVSRGGSRKLDPSGEYASEFSEKWHISINS